MRQLFCLLSILSVLSKIRFSPLRRRGRRVEFSCLAGRCRQTKTCPFRTMSLSRTTGRWERPPFGSSRDDVSGPIAVSRLDQKKSTSQRSPRLCGEPEFKRSRFESKSSIESMWLPKTFAHLGQQWSIIVTNESIIEKT